MTVRPEPVEATVVLEPCRDIRLLPYAFIALGGFGAAVLGGQPYLAMISAPFLVALVLGLRRTGRVRVHTRVTVDRDRVVEGDPLTLHVRVWWDSPFDARLILHRLTGVVVVNGSARALASRSVRSLELTVRLQGSRWGRHTLGEFWLRLRVPFGLLTWSGPVTVTPVVRVLPAAEKLNHLLHPRNSRAVWGFHPSRRLADGHEFAELHPYTPGDRLRDLNWAATARLRRPIVNRHHPELSGQVVIALDGFSDGSTSSTEALSRAARAAWALASLHLRANDRVGLVGLGGSTQWLPPAGGLQARYRLMDALLRVGGEAAERVAPARRYLPVPPSALIVVLTPLHTRGAVDAAALWRGRGRSVVVMVIDPVDFDGTAGSESERLGGRLWRIDRRRRVDELESFGVPVMIVPPDGNITPAIAALEKARRRSAPDGVHR